VALRQAKLDPAEARRLWQELRAQRRELPEHEAASQGIMAAFGQGPFVIITEFGMIIYLLSVVPAVIAHK